MSLVRKYFKSSFIFDLVMTSFSQLGITIIISHLFGTFGKGLHSFLGLFSTVIVPLFFLGMGQSLRYHLASNYEKIKLRNLFVPIILISFGIFIFCFSYNSIFNNQTFNYIIDSIGIMGFYFFIILSSFSYILIKYSLGKSYFTLYFISNSIQLFVLFIVLLIFYYFNYESVYCLLIILVFSKLIFILPNITFNIWKEKNINGSSFLKNLIPYAKKAWINDLVNNVINRLDQIIIAFLLPLEQLGIYTIAVVFSELIMKIPQTGNNLFFNKIVSKNDIERELLFGKIFSLNFYLCISLFIIAYILTPFFINIVFPSNFNKSILIFKIYIIGVLFFNQTRVVYQFLGATGKPEINTKIQLKGFLIALPFTFVLIYNYKLVGVAYSAVVQYFVLLIISLIELRKIYIFKLSKLFFLNKNHITWALNLLRK